MSEIGIHDSSLYLQHMFEPIVTFREFFNLLRMHDKSIHLYIYT